jgi:acetyltransferase-like isoleucine patch superfamily enzyme
MRIRRLAARVARALLRLLALVIALPAAAGCWAQAALVGRDTALENWSELAGLLPGVTGNHIRRAFLRLTVEHCHPTASIGHGTLFSKAAVCIEENVYIGARCHIALAHFERGAMLSPGVHVTSGPHTHGIDDASRPIRAQPETVTMVRLGAGCWIGSAAIVMADVGEDAVVGAGAVVTRPVPARMVAMGIPARVVRARGSSRRSSDHSQA